MIAYALEHLAAGGFVTRTGDEDGGTYRVLHRSAELEACGGAALIPFRV